MTKVSHTSVADGDHQTVVCDDEVRLNLRLWNRPSQEAVLFIHGLGSNQEQFSADAAFFADTGYSAATLDLRGHGRSSTPSPCSRSTLTVERMAQDVLRALEVIPAQKVHIFGNSLGGLVGIKICESNSDRIASLTTGGTAYRLRTIPGIATLSHGLLKLFGQKRLAAFTARRLVFNPNARHLVQTLMGAFELEVVRHIQSNIARYDYRAIVRDFDGPLLILRGEHDRAINKRLAASWKTLCNKDNVKLVKLSGVGHFTNLDDPKQFRTALLTFFSQIATDAAKAPETDET